MSDHNSKKWRIFGYQTDIEWYDVKTKIKQLTRKVFYSFLVQESMAWLIKIYIEFVFVTSQIKFINFEVAIDSIKNRSPLIFAFWHNRLMMIPIIAKLYKKNYPNHNFMTLASKHGDGRIVGKVMEKFGLISVLGSTKVNKKSSRGIDYSSLRQIIDGLKRGYALGVTPDGPRGPNQQINGEIINIARISQAKIIAISYSCSRFYVFKSWDQFKLPLPFSNICFYFDQDLILVERDIDQEKIFELEKKLLDKLNNAQSQADQSFV